MYSRQTYNGLLKLIRKFVFQNQHGLPGIIEKMNDKIKSRIHNCIWLAASVADCPRHHPIITLLLDQAGDLMQNRNICSSASKIPILHENSGSGSTSFFQEPSEINTADSSPQWVASEGYPTVLAFWEGILSKF